MAKKTNKTSHVLSLLTNSAPAENTDSAVSGQEKKNDVPSHTATSPKVTVVDEGSRNDRVSQEILGKLSDELANIVPEEDSAPIEQSAPTRVQIPKATVQTADTAPELLEELDVPQEVPLTPAQPEASSSLKSESQLGEQFQDDDFHFINVMEELVAQNDLDTILRQYNVCTCTRCKADVCALTLTCLPAKYVVASEHSISPILNYYKNRYRISILAELSKACAIVREHSHHSR